MMVDVFPFVVGVLGSFHCLGMCGVLVFACTLSPAADDAASGKSAYRSSRSLLLQVAFHLGRLTTYGTMGAVASGFFSALQVMSAFNGWVSPATIACGVMLLFLSLTMTRLVPVPGLTDRLLSAPLSAIVSRAPALIRSQSLFKRFILGLLTGLLPCCLSWSMVVTVVPEGNPWRGALTMIVFGLGTVPALVAAALFGVAVSAALRQMVERLAAIAIGAMGIALLIRGFGIIG